MTGDPTGADPELVTGIYDAVIDPSQLREVMSRFANQMDCDAAYFKMIDRATAQVVVGVGGGMPEGSDQDYLQNYLASDIRVPRVNRAQRGTILDDRHVISGEERRKSPFHNEFLPRYGLAHLLHVNVSPTPQFSTIVTCGQGWPHDEFEVVQHRLLSAYVPHFERSGSLRTRLMALGGEAMLMSAAFDSLPMAGFILSSEGEVMFANRAAREIVTAGDGLVVHNGRLAAVDAVGAKTLEAEIRRATLRTPMASEGDLLAFLLGRPSGKPHYRLEVRPLPTWSGIHREASAAAVMVLVHDPGRIAPLPATVLRQLYGLTPAEAALALAVSAGTSLRDYAGARGISVNTVRYQLKQVLAKTECRRQTDLVRLLTSGRFRGGG